MPPVLAAIRAIPKSRANADIVPNGPYRILYRTDFSEYEPSAVQFGRHRSGPVAVMANIDNSGRSDRMRCPRVARLVDPSSPHACRRAGANTILPANRRASDQ